MLVYQRVSQSEMSHPHSVPIGVTQLAPPPPSTAPAASARPSASARGPRRQGRRGDGGVQILAELVPWVLGRGPGGRRWGKDGKIYGKCMEK